MAEQFTLYPTKTSSLRRARSSESASWTDNWKQAKGEEHMVQGFETNHIEQFRHLLQFAMPDWSNVASITKAELHVFVAGDHSGMKTEARSPLETNFKAAVKSKSWTEAGGGEKLWTGGLPDDGANYLNTYKNKDTRAYAKVPATNLAHVVVNVGNLVRYWAPTSIKTPWGTGQGRPNYGLVTTTAGSKPAYYKHEVVLASPKHVNTGIRPYLVITYEPKGGPGAVVLDLPDGTVPAGVANYLTGSWERGRPGDTMVSVTIQVQETGKAAATWVHNADPNEVATSSFSVPLDLALVKSGITYAWTAKVKTSKGDETPYAPTQTLRLASAPPSLTVLGPTGSHATLDSVPFSARYTASAGQYRAQAWQVQMRTQLADTDPTWGEDLLWDTGLMTVALGAEAATPVTTPPFTVDLKTLYGGPGLVPSTTYSYRMRALDPFGSDTGWKYGTFSLTAAYISPDDDVRVNMTRYGKPPPHRIRIYAVDLTAGKGRGPGKLLAELTDAANVGASEYYNSPGEFYFTLPAIHPQVAVIEPYQVHYELQIHTGQGWKGIAFGLITDFDATEDEVVFYGQDYLGLLARTVEERFSTADAELSVDKGGGKYENKSVKDIIVDQLTKEKAKANSPIGFINVNAADIANMPEKATIYTSFKQRLPFISGLIDSSRAGTGRRTRILPTRNSDGVWRWRVVYQPGIDRPNIRMEYGGIVQGFRTIPFSDWGTAVDALGRTVTGVRVYSARAVAPGISEATYGAFPTTTMYQDIDDSADLQRRANQAAAKVAKVGKMLGLGIRVGALAIKDGWDICDSVPVDIVRGVVNTNRFGPDVNGKSWWTIWGWTWNSYADGHSNMVLSLSPREDNLPPNPDLIESKPILDLPEWQLDSVPPTAADDGIYWLDTSTGDVYEKQPDGTWLMTATMMGPEGPPGEEGPPGPPGDIGVIGEYIWKTAASGSPSAGQVTALDAPVAGTDNTLRIYIVNNTGENQGGPISALLPGDAILLEWPGGTLRLPVKGVPTGTTVKAVPVGPWPAISPLQPPSLTAVTGTIMYPGPAGPTGPAGAAGAPGAPGAAGPPGAPGQDGESGGKLGEWAWLPGASPGGVTDGEWGQTSTPVAGGNNTLSFGKVDNDNILRTAHLLALKVGDIIDMMWASGSMRFTVRALPSDAGPEWVNVPVTWPTAAPLQPSPSYVLTEGTHMVPGPTGPAGAAGPPGADAGADTTIPAAPVLSGFTSAVSVDANGQPLVELRVTVAHPTTNSDASAITDLFGTHVEFTDENDEDPLNPQPIWTNAAIILVGSTSTLAVLKGVAGKKTYWARARSRDVAGHVGAYSVPNVSTLTTKDPTAPSVPSGLVATPGFKAVGLTWAASSVNDLMFNEVRYAPELTPGVPDTTVGTWSPPALRVRTNTVVVTGLPVTDPAKPYYFQVRAVDQSGNVATSDTVPDAVDYLANPEAGWSPLVSATPSLVGAEDMSFDTVVTNFLTSGEISAGMITSGTIKVDPTGDAADGIEVWLGTVRVGIWDETGLYVGNNTVGLPDNLSSSDYVRITNAGLTVYLAGVPQAAITPAGINASAVNFGSLPGGMNLVKNSSFELAAFGTTTPNPKDWTAAADWTTTQQTNTNATNGAGAINVTNVAY